MPSPAAGAVVAGGSNVHGDPLHGDYIWLLCEPVGHRPPGKEVTMGADSRSIGNGVFARFQMGLSVLSLVLRLIRLWRSPVSCR